MSEAATWAISPAHITVDLGRFVGALRFDDLPEAVPAIVSMGIADSIGCLIAGRYEAAPQILVATIDPQQQHGATILLGDRAAPAPEAALINGTAIHALDFDDGRFRGHMSAALVPGLLAEAELCGASGADVITAYVAGYETWAELVLRERGHHHKKGWHPTGVFGSIAAAAACASLRHLDASQTAMALGLAASTCSGLTANFGSMSKPLHAGNAARAGLMAARLAAAGMTASPDALEHSQGLLMAISPEGDVDLESPVSTGQVWRIASNGLNIKKYPVCYCAHRSIDGLLDLLSAEPVRADEVASIVVSMSGRNATVLRNHTPRTGLEAKFSIEFALAAAIVAGRVGLGELTDAFVLRPEVQRLIGLVRIELDPREDPLTGYAPHDTVRIQTRDGRLLRSAEVTVARGNFQAPLTLEDRWRKFVGCAEYGAFEGDPAPLFDALTALERQADIRGVPGLFRRQVPYSSGAL